MHLKPARTAARAAAIGGVMVLGLGSATAAMASPDAWQVPCNTNALFYALANVDSGGTLILAGGCTYYLPGSLVDGTDNLTIVGNGATLEGGGPNSDFAILGVDCMEHLTLDGVSFTRGWADDDGGAIDNSGYLTINGGVFSNNGGGEGGAIDSGGVDSSLTIHNAVFTRNSASDEGGAIADDSDTTIVGASFGDNNGYDGGALYVDGETTVVETSFLGNVGEYGGAIDNEDGLMLGNIEGVAGSGNTLEGNKADEGGGIYNDGGAYVEFSLIVSNEAHRGGGIYNTNCGDLLGLTGSTLYSNVTDNLYQESGAC
jgi:predicted outer membrane repeat protein